MYIQCTYTHICMDANERIWGKKRMHCDQHLSSGNSREFKLIKCFTVIPAGTIQIATQGEGVPGLHTLTMSNATTAGGTIVQYAQGQDAQFFVPGVSRLHLFYFFSFILCFLSLIFFFFFYFIFFFFIFSPTLAMSEKYKIY